MPSRSAGSFPAVAIGLLLLLRADPTRSARQALRTQIFARDDSTALTGSTCPNPDFEQCGNGMPDDFCCISGATCISLAGNTTAICCISRTCDQVPPVSCDLSLQNVANYPNTDLMTILRTMSLPTCGEGCCPFGYSCGLRKNNAVFVPACHIDVDQSQVPTQKSIVAASGFSLALGATRMASTPVIVVIVLSVAATAAIVVGLIVWRRKSRHRPAQYPSSGLTRWKKKPLSRWELPIDLDEHELQFIDFMKNGRPSSTASSTATVFATSVISPSIESRPRGGMEDRIYSDDSEADGDMGTAYPARFREGSDDGIGGSRPAPAPQSRKQQSRAPERRDSPPPSRSPPAYAEAASSASRGLRYPPSSNGGGATNPTVQAANPPHHPQLSPLNFHLALPASRRLSAVPASLNVLKKALSPGSDQEWDDAMSVGTAPQPSTLTRPASTLSSAMLLPVRYQPDLPPKRGESAATEATASPGNKMTVRPAAGEPRKASTGNQNVALHIRQPVTGVRKPSLVVNDKFSPTVGKPIKMLERPISPLDNRAPTLPSLILPPPLPRGPPGRLNIPAIFQNTSQAMPEFGSIPIQVPDLYQDTPDDASLLTGMRTSLSQFNFSLDIVDAPPLPRGPMTDSASRPTLPSINLPPATLPTAAALSAAAGPLSLGRLSFDVPLTLDARLARVLQKKDAGAAAP